MQVLAIFFLAVSLVHAYNWKNVHIGGGGGFVPGIVFNPNAQGVAYARTDIGGLYRINDDGKWTQLLDWLDNTNGHNLGVLSVATDPVTPSNVYAVVGLYTNEWSPNPGSVLRSSDYGNTWSETVLTFKIGGNEAGRGCGERLAIDPNNNNILFLAASNGNGLWKSTDSGVTWNQVSSFTTVGDFVAGGNIVGVLNVVFDTTSSTIGGATSRIFVGVATTSSESVYVSNDAGSTWNPVSGQPVGVFPHRMKLSPAEEYLYVSFSNTAGPYDGGAGSVYRYDISDGSWVDITPAWGANNGYTFGYGGLAVDAQSPGTIMVASDNLWYPDNQIFRSNDSGTTWATLWDGDTKYYTYNTDLAPWIKNSRAAGQTLTLGWMIESLEIDPFDSNHWLYGTGLTIYGGYNLQSWPNVLVESLADGIEEELVYKMLCPPGGAPLISALGDISGFVHQDLDTPPDQWFLNNAYSSTGDIDYAGQVPFSIVRIGNLASDGFSQMSRSFDGAVSWTPATVNSNTTAGGKVAISADANNIVWCTASEGTYIFVNGYQQTVSTLASGSLLTSDKVDETYFYAADSSSFYVSDDGGMTFSATFSLTAAPNSIKVHPTVAGDIWLTTDNGMFHSTDYGSTFSQISGVSVAYDIALGLGANEYPNIYSFLTTSSISSSLAISEDKGITWTEISNEDYGFGVSEGNTLAASMEVAGRVFVGTNGRGIFYGTP